MSFIYKYDSMEESYKTPVKRGKKPVMSYQPTNEWIFSIITQPSFSLFQLVVLSRMSCPNSEIYHKNKNIDIKF